MPLFDSTKIDSSVPRSLLQYHNRLCSTGSYSLTYFFTYSLIDLLTHPLIYVLTSLLTYFLTYLLINLSTYSFTNLRTYLGPRLLLLLRISIPCEYPKLPECAIRLGSLPLSGIHVYDVSSLLYFFSLGVSQLLEWAECVEYPPLPGRHVYDVS